MVKVAPSLLSANFAYLKEEINAIKAADWIHYDVMDGHFVPNISFGYSILKDVSKVTDMYLDVHLMLDGTEQIDLNFIQNMQLKEFVEKDDFLPMDGDKNSSVVLNKGDFLVCYPSDGHRTAVKAKDEPETIKKAIFKVKID